MFKQLKTGFIQTTLGSIIWFTLLASFIFTNKDIPFNFIWHLLAISGLFGLTFGVIYPYFWKFSTLGATLNIIFSTIINVICGLLGIYLFSPEMFFLVKPYILGVIILTFVAHIIAFYFYSKHENQKEAKQLNQLLS